MQNPSIKVLANNTDISSLVTNFELSTSLYGEINSFTLSFRDIENRVAPTLSKGNTINIQWGYDDGLNDLFEGVIISVNSEKEDAQIKALDYSIGLNSIFISNTFIEETASNILTTVLGESSLELDIEESDLTYKVFPIFDESVTSILKKITKDVKAHTGIQQIYTTNGNLFTWKALDTTTSPVMAFITGENIISWVEGKSLTTLIVPVLVGDIIDVNDTNYLVESATYKWKDGGRVILGVKAV